MNTDRIVRDSNFARDPADTAELAWLIEKADSPASRPLYLMFYMDETFEDQASTGYGWTSDHNDAVWFARGRDAAMFWKCLMGKPADDVRIAQHGFN